MSILATLLLAAALVALLRVPLQRAPVVFYVLAALFDLLLIGSQQLGVPVVLWRVMLTLNSRCLLAFALFAIVMFTGVLKDGSRLKRTLMPIRAELSIVAAILAAGHVLNYAHVFASRLLGETTPSTALFTTTALVLALLLAVLTITSLKVVKQRMLPRTWKGVQRLAYVFWTLVLVHALLALGPSAWNGATSAQVSLTVYLFLFITYAVMRIRRYLLDRHQPCSPVQDALDRAALTPSPSPSQSQPSTCKGPYS